MITGIICEYNPFHSGHKKQIDAIRAADPEATIVCLMSGNYVQRGTPAIFDKVTRAKAAILCGADLVLELPVTYSLRSAEGFAAGGVSVLSGFCDQLCFGAETPDASALTNTAKALLSESFSSALRIELDRGLSFPAARQAALETLGIDASLVETPNNILAVEYCKAILSQGCSITPMPICRNGNYHSLEADKENPSATFIRSRIYNNEHWQSYVPMEAAACFEDATIHTLKAGQRAILFRLRTMTENEFESLPYGSEGLWRKFMYASHQCATLEEIIAATKSKRYTRTRLDRMVMCAFLGITQEILDAPAPYARVLALNDKGRVALKSARCTGNFPNIGEPINGQYSLMESTWDSLYGLFSKPIPESPSIGKLRLFYK